MATYAGFISSATPVAGVANWILETVANVEALVKEVTFGGQSITSIAMQTRIARDTTVGGGTRTAGSVQKFDQHSPANLAFFSTSYSTAPSITAGALFGTSWNSHGGVVRWLADPAYVISAYDATTGNAGIECRADVGVGVSSYHLVWQEL